MSLQIPFFKPRKPAGYSEAPELSGGIPILGHTVEFVRSAIDLLGRAQREQGEVAAFQVANKRMVAMFGPEAHEAVFRAPDVELSPSEAYKIMTPVFGKDIVYDAPPEKMSEQVKMLLPALKDKRMRTYGESILEEVEGSIRSWGDEGIVDFVDYCRVLTNFTSSRCLLGQEFRSGMTEEFARVYHDLERGVTPLAYINAQLPIPSFRARDKARVRLVEMITEIIQERRTSGRTGEDFLQTLMDARYQSGAALSEHEITGMLLAAMFAGHHTSSVTTAWTMIELLQNRALGERVVGELDHVFADDPHVTYQKLRDIHFTEASVKEALRLHPPLFMLVRVVKQPWEYKRYRFEPGTWLVISPTVAHRIPTLFRDPERFDPDRFLPPREEDKRDFAYIPFGGGRHKCLGNAFAFLQVKAILAVLLRRYEFEMVDRDIGSNFHGLVVGPTEPCRVRYRRRKEKNAVTSGYVAVQAPKATEGQCPFSGAEGTVKPKLRIELDIDLCQGHAVCVGEAPEIFAVGEDQKVKLLRQPDESLYKGVMQAAKHCPTHTIRLVTEPAAS
jgi:sterol 14alpha-demethylase